MPEQKQEQKLTMFAKVKKICNNMDDNIGQKNVEKADHEMSIKEKYY